MVQHGAHAIGNKTAPVPIVSQNKKVVPIFDSTGAKVVLINSTGAVVK